MNTTQSTSSTPPTATEQLALFPLRAGIPERFRIDEATRQRGLFHAARIRAQLEARRPSRPRPERPDRPALGSRATRRPAA
ncbi:hypothetical protein BH24ACT5_BH24ACT5_27400 [soil metagenome]